MGNIHQRVNGRVPRLPRRHCSSLYAEPDAGRVCLNTHVIYIHFSLLLCFFFSSFRGVISQRWRSDTFDNCGPCGVNTEVIACLCLLLSRTISECLSPRLFTDRQRGGDWHKGRWGCGPERAEYVPLFHYLTHHFAQIFTILKPSSLQRVQIAIFTVMIKR